MQTLNFSLFKRTSCFALNIVDPSSELLGFYLWLRNYDSLEAIEIYLLGKDEFLNYKLGSAIDSIKEFLFTCSDEAASLLRKLYFNVKLIKFSDIEKLVCIGTSNRARNFHATFNCEKLSIFTSPVTMNIALYNDFLNLAGFHKHVHQTSSGFIISFRREDGFKVTIFVNE